MYEAQHHFLEMTAESARALAKSKCSDAALNEVLRRVHLTSLKGEAKVNLTGEEARNYGLCEQLKAKGFIVNECLRSLSWGNTV